MRDHPRCHPCRYEIWCIARAAATRSCVLHCDVPAQQCREWNAARPEQDAYSPAVFDDLAGRFERPDGRGRWDSPLFECVSVLLALTIYIYNSLTAKSELAVNLLSHAFFVAGMLLWRHKWPGGVRGALCRQLPALMCSIFRFLRTRPGDEGVDATLQQVVAATLGTATGAAAAPQPSRDMTPTYATAPKQQAATNLLSDIDRAAQSVIGAPYRFQQIMSPFHAAPFQLDFCVCHPDALLHVLAACVSASRIMIRQGHQHLPLRCAGTIMQAQTASGGAAGPVSFGEGVDELVLTDPVSLPELRRHKRSFMKLATQNAFSTLRSSEAATRMFVSYLQDQLE